MIVVKTNRIFLAASRKVRVSLYDVGVNREEGKESRVARVAGIYISRDK